MGNFSRNTFELNKNKNYVGVRLQQGVPLVDADWNELDDAIRNEVYSGLGHAFPDGVEPGSQSLQIRPTSPEATNNLMMRDGSVLISGRPLRIPTTILYSDQPWFSNPTRADQDGVTVIPPLTPSSVGIRTDIVYLDIWEREVRSTEDGNLIHPAIGVETCIRLKREFAFRVAEGTQILPVTPAGHAFMPLALLNRPVGQGNILFQHIEDIRPQLFSTRGKRSISFFPAFLPLGTATNPWTFDPNTHVARTTTNEALGLLPMDLPEGASLLKLLIHVSTTTAITFSFFRKQQNATPSEEPLCEGSLPAKNGAPTTYVDQPFDISQTDRKHIVDKGRYNYLFRIKNGAASSFPTSVARIIITYQY
jgi:hypothetical protein